MNPKCVFCDNPVFNACVEVPGGDAHPYCVVKQWEECRRLLADAVKLVTYEQAYKGAMTVAQAEDAFRHMEPVLGRVEIAHDACHTFASFDVAAARKALKGCV